MDAAGRVFVGRQREMGALKAALEDALSGRGCLVMLVGEPGIGKTRTAQELAAIAQQQGAQVLQGWCYEGEGAPAYWPWVQLIRSYVQQRKPDQLRLLMGPGAADIAEIFPEVRGKLPDLESTPALDSPEAARFRLFDSITTFLQNASQGQPLMLVLDDLQWADKPSLLLLQFLARQMAGSRLLVVGAYRDVALSRQHPLAETLGDLTKERLFQRVLLRGLGQQDVSRFIELAAGVSPPPGLVEGVYRQTEGNPLFVTEVVRLLVQEGNFSAHPEPVEGRGSTSSPRAGGQESWSVRIPEGVLEAIGQRLNRLSEQCNEALTTASVIGREFSLGQLDQLIQDLSGDRLLQVLEEALAAGVIQEVAGSAERYQFSHALIQQTLASGLSAARRVRLHARIAGMLEELYGPQAEAHAAQLAHHFAEAAAVLGTGKLVHYSLLAGERALAVYGWEEALVHFQRGLAAKGVPPEGTVSASDGEEAALLFGLGRARAATLETHQMQEAVANLNRAFDYYAKVGGVEQAVAIAEYPLSMLPGHSTGVAQLIDRALALVPPDSHEAGRLLSRYARVLVVEERDYDAAQGAFGRALSIARREGDEALEMRTLSNVAEPDLHYLRLQGSLVKSLRAAELARLADDPRTEVDARYVASLNLWWMGDLEGMRSNAVAALALAEKLRDHYWLTTALWTNEIVSRLAGNWGTARDFNNRCLAMSPMDPRPLYTRAMLEAEVGDLGQVQAHLERLLEVTHLTPRGPTLVHGWAAMVTPMVARITGVTDTLDAAQASSTAVLSSRATTPTAAMMASGALALLAVLRNDIAAAKEQYAALESGGSLMVPTTFMSTVRMVPFTFMSIVHLLGLLAQIIGKLDEATAHFEVALTFSRRAGYRPEYAWTCCDYADLLLQRNNPGDHQEAVALLNEALAISNELGMRPLVERVLSRENRAGLQRAAVPAYPDGLTQREVEVLGLIALGKSNRDIAQDLLISLRTVANHVTNILNKTGAANRTEAARYAFRRGLD